MICLGIDPGSRRTGYGVVEARGSTMRHLCSGVISAETKLPLADRLSFVFTELERILSENRPDAIFVESIFHAASAKSALILGQARGVALLAAARRGAERVCEITPAEVKKGVVGHGRADKHQVKEMVRVILGLRETLATDASDALAIAIAGAHQARFAQRLSPIPSKGLSA